jgi:periplasmic protein TonB
MKQLVFQDIATTVGSLSIALFLSFTLHSLLLTAKFEPKPSYQTNTKLEIVLVQTKTNKAPKDAKFISQANQDGGGIDHEEERAKTPVRAPFHALETNIVTSPFPFQQQTQSQTEQLQVITINESLFEIKNKQNQQDMHIKTQTTGEDLQNTPNLPMTESDFLKNQRSTIASIQSDSDEKYQEFKNRPPHKIVGSKTKGTPYAKYIDEWIRKVERVAMTQKPPKELKKKLKGSLIVKVSFRSDGTLFEIEILQSSHNLTLDDYTLQVARMATPFKPFDKDKKMLEELGQHGILEIVRTWKWNLSPQTSNKPEEHSLKLDNNDE